MKIFIPVLVGTIQFHIQTIKMALFKNSDAYIAFQTTQLYLQIDQNGIIRYVGSCRDSYNRESVHKTRSNNPSASNGAKSTDYEKNRFILAGNTLRTVTFNQFFDANEALIMETAIYELLKPDGQLFNQRSPLKAASQFFNGNTQGYLYNHIIESIPEFEYYFQNSWFSIPIAA